MEDGPGSSRRRRRRVQLPPKGVFLRGSRLQEPWAILLPPSLRPKAAIRPSTARATRAREFSIDSWRLTTRTPRPVGRTASKDATGSGGDSSIPWWPATSTDSDPRIRQIAAYGVSGAPRPSALIDDSDEVDASDESDEGVA